MHTHVKKKRKQHFPGKSLVGLSNLFSLETLLTAYIVKETFLQINHLVAWRHRARPNSATID